MAAKRFPDRDEVAAVRAMAEQLEPGATDDTTKRRLAGRVMARRDMGKLVFLDLVDRSGRIQLICPTEQTGELDLHLGDIVGVTGSPARARRGEPSLQVDELEFLARIRAPLPDTFHGIEDVELRYRKRYLDLLMSEESRDETIKRARMVSAIRAYLDGEGFIEVETPILQPRYGGGFAEPFTTHSELLDADLYLRIADELYLKRLIVGGLEKVYELSKDFRNESYSYKHSPEFTQVEWYEAYADYKDTAARMTELVAKAADATNGTTVTKFRGATVDLSQWREIRFVDALEEKGAWTRDEVKLRARLVDDGVDVTRDRTWSELIDHAYSHYVEPLLIEPTIVYDWPIELSPFARTTDDQETLVERFEAVVGGMEIANAFSELNDSNEQAVRFALQAVRRGQGDVEAEPGDTDYVEAMSYGMAPNGGCGVGVDRLAMILLGKDTIRDVILFPTLRARG
jgi:lysyl-tRNA synthetase, class II